MKESYAALQSADNMHRPIMYFSWQWKSERIPSTFPY